MIKNSSTNKKHKFCMWEFQQTVGGPDLQLRRFHKARIRWEKTTSPEVSVNYTEYSKSSKCLFPNEITVAMEYFIHDLFDMFNDFHLENTIYFNAFHITH